jgi:hypothetical protein
MAGDRHDFLRREMRGLPPNAALAFLLSAGRPGDERSALPDLSDGSGICAGSTPWPAAASATVAVLPSSSTMAMSGRGCQKARTDSRLILTSAAGIQHHG